MQVLWSRAAQARSSCRCSACLHVATTLARRTTTAASKCRLRISDVFTACYSTILATAAFADAKVKEERRKEWDRLIEEAKELSKRNKRATRGSDTNSGPETADWDVLKPLASTVEASDVPIETYKPFLDNNSSQDSNALQDNNWNEWTLPPRTEVPALGQPLTPLDWKLRNSTVERITARDVDSVYRPGLGEVGQWIEEIFDPDLFHREPRSPLHLEKLEDMVANLVNRILEESKIFSNLDQPRVGCTMKTHHEMREITKRFVALNVGVSRMPVYNYDDIDVVEDQRKALHHSLYAACFTASRGQGHLDVAIAKICYNMLVSQAPPSITTYNLLLNEFYKMERHDLGQIVVDSFLHESRLRPNKRTIRLLLDHYRAKHDFEGFNNIIQRMRGTEGNLRIRTRHIFHLGKRPVEKWASNNAIIHRSGYLVQKAPRSRPVFNSLILGSLEFNKVRAAVRYARAALREGHQISAETLCAVIRACLHKLDAYAGSSLLRALLSQWEDGSLLVITVYSKDLRLFINQLLLLCGINSTSIRSDRGLPSHVSPHALDKLMWYMQLGTVTDLVERSANFLLQVDAALDVSGLDISYSKIIRQPSTEPATLERLEWAMQIFRKQSKLQGKRIRDREMAKRKGWRLRLKVLDNMVTTSFERMGALEKIIDELQLEAKKVEIESFLCNIMPMQPRMTARIVQKYALAFTTAHRRQPVFDHYPMFQQRKSESHRRDPILFLEENLVNVGESQFHRNIMSELDIDLTYVRRKRFTTLRLKYIERILDAYLEPKAGERKHHMKRAYDLASRLKVDRLGKPGVSAQKRVCQAELAAEPIATAAKSFGGSRGWSQARTVIATGPPSCKPASLRDRDSSEMREYCTVHMNLT